MRKILFLVLGFGMSLLFTGCASKGGTIAYKISKDYLTSKHAAMISDKDDAVIYRVSSSNSGIIGISREAMRKDAAAALFQGCATLGLKIKRPYFYIIKPSKFASFGINTMTQVDKMCINGSGGGLNSLVSLFDAPGINRGCEFGMGGDKMIKHAFAKVAFYKKQPLSVPTFNAHKVLSYLKKHNMIEKDVSDIDFSWGSEREADFSKWDRMTR